ncbi:MAG: hypothetical protein EBZ40_05505 [Gammaproteobacteria bacterium]|nr:hypothetical protein [Gammaproteobacteria bacterium]
MARAAALPSSVGPFCTSSNQPRLVSRSTPSRYCNDSDSAAARDAAAATLRWPLRSSGLPSRKCCKNSIEESRNVNRSSSRTVSLPPRVQSIESRFASALRKASGLALIRRSTGSR